MYFALIFIKSHINYLTNWNSKILLGSGFFYLKEAVVWYWAYARIRTYLELNQVDVIFYHGEFNSWGLSVSWACRDSGVIAIAWQHGMISPGYEQYNLTDNDKKCLPLPSKLFLWSDFSKQIADKFLGGDLQSIKVGQSRITTSYDSFKKRNKFKYLICPSKYDSLIVHKFLIKNKTLLSTDDRLIYKPHPIGYIKINSSFKQKYNCVESDINDILDEISVIILSHGTVAIEALRKQIPVIVVNEFCAEEHLQYLVEMPGLFISRTLQEALVLLDEIEKKGNKLDRSQFHNTARYFAADLNVVAVQKVINRLT